MRRRTICFAVAALFCVVIAALIWRHFSWEGRFADELRASGHEVEEVYVGPEWLPEFVLWWDVFRRIVAVRLASSEADVETFRQLGLLPELHSLDASRMRLTDDELAPITASQSITHLAVSGDFTCEGLMLLSDMSTIRKLRVLSLESENTPRNPARCLDTSNLRHLELRTPNILSEEVVELAIKGLGELLLIGCKNVTPETVKAISEKKQYLRLVIKGAQFEQQDVAQFSRPLFEILVVPKESERNFGLLRTD